MVGRWVEGARTIGEEECERNQSIGGLTRPRGFRSGKIKLFNKALLYSRLCASHRTTMHNEDVVPALGAHSPTGNRQTKNRKCQCNVVNAVRGASTGSWKIQ